MNVLSIHTCHILFVITVWYGWVWRYYWCFFWVWFWYICDEFYLDNVLGYWVNWWMARFSFTNDFSSGFEWCVLSFYFTTGFISARFVLLMISLLDLDDMWISFDRVIFHLLMILMMFLGWCFCFWITHCICNSGAEYDYN